MDGRTWTIMEETVDARGVSSVTGDQLASIELDAQAAEDLLEKVPIHRAVRSGGASRGRD